LEAGYVNVNQHRAKMIFQSQTQFTVN
jgi:hypothetical protein